jgi:hypothetical protein
MKNQYKDASERQNDAQYAEIAVKSGTSTYRDYPIEKIL